MEQRKPLIVLTGPTAVGKTRLSLSLARAVGGEIVSADSMQVYEYMDIGSAKVKPEEREGIPHHLIDILKPWEPFNVVLFKRLCEQAFEGIYERGHIPILTGGTGFYIQSVLYGIDFTETAEDTAYREELTALANTQGTEALHTLLKEADPAAAAAIHPHNVKRVIRALEFHRQTGASIEAHNQEERRKESRYASCYFVLNDDRDKLYERIDERVEEMLACGLLEEVKELLAMGCKREMVSMQGLGYKEIIASLEGEYDPEEAIRRIKRDTRHFAKRQLTWFRREKEVIWVEKPTFAYDEEAMIAFMCSCFQKRLREEQERKE